MAKDGYTIIKSNYSLKKFHKNVTGGTIYERDFMGTNNLGGFDSGSIPNIENNFKMVYRNETNSLREHSYGDFLENEKGETGWTLNNGASQSLTSESEIVKNPDNTTLLSYVYYGNCTQLVLSSIRKIVNNFPAELWSDEEQIESIPSSIISEELYVLNNEFDIDIVTKKLDSEIEFKVNPFRYFYLSYGRYFISQDSVNKGCIDAWKVEDSSGESRCYYDKKITLINRDKTFEIHIYRFWINKKPVYMANKKNLKIRLGDGDIETFFSSLDDFQKLLLNRDSDPLYTAILDYPHETKYGIGTYRKKFTWPIINEWNLDIITDKYEQYISSLLSLCTFYDEYNTDNLWKYMTHDSIKNMDITFSRKGSDEDKEDYNEGTTKIEGLLWAYGRQFDEIKRSVDCIKANNTITYNNNGNIPDYFLTDTLNLSGWEVSSSVKGLLKKNEIISVKDLFDGSNKEYTCNDANIIFMKNLKINSSNILSKKGTRNGIEEILSVFGYASDDFKGKGKGDYSINEYVNIATVKSKEGTRVSSDETLSAETFNELKTNVETDTPESESFDTLQGLPVVLYYYVDEKNNLMKTIIPWFKEVSEMDGELYFQMYGGWEKIPINFSGDSRYVETIGYLNIVKNCSELKRISKSKLPKFENNIVYVNDISDCSDNANESHYFKQSGNTSIWTAVEKDSPEVKSLTSIIEEYRGNNPHTGYGNYDDGKEYLKYYEQIFHYAIENDLFMDEAYECKTGKLKEDIKKQGFELKIETDNKKCYYFYDKDIEKLDDATGLRELEYSATTKIIYVDKNMDYVTGSPYGKDVRNITGDTNIIHSEPSIINVKNLTITFRLKDNHYEKEYIEQSVLPYLTQMIPSTTILEIKYEQKIN